MTNTTIIIYQPFCTAQLYESYILPYYRHFPLAFIRTGITTDSDHSTFCTQRAADHILEIIGKKQ